MKNKKRLSLYIHIPFCVQKCRYCDFYSAAATAQEKLQYTELLCREIRSWGRMLREQYSVYTIFMGGGTPTCLTPDCLEKIGKEVRESFDCDALTEFTTEANPGTVTPEHLTAWQQMGISRVSLGLQSAQNRELQMLGRIHSYEEFLTTYQMIRQSGMDQINIDVMAAIPEQTLESYQDTLEKIVSLNPEHISSYSLIVEPETVFGDWEKNGTLKRVDEDTDRQMYEWTGKYLQQMGYHRYEISNYCRSGMECKHNCVYWTGGEYLGLGVNASSYLKGYRFRVPVFQKSYRSYVDRICQLAGNGSADLQNAIQGMDELEIIDQKEQMEEFMFLGLRMMAGVSEEEFFRRFGSSMMDVYGDVIKKYQKMDLICRKDTGQVALTEKGIDVSNSILADFLLSD